MQKSPQIKYEGRIEGNLKVDLLIENLVCLIKEGDIDISSLDHLDSHEHQGSQEGIKLKSFLNSLEMLASHWQIIRRNKYTYRLKSYSNLEVSSNYKINCRK